MEEDIEEYNNKILEFFSLYLNEIPTYLCDKNIKNKEEIIANLSKLGKYEDDQYFKKRLWECIFELEIDDYINNPYYKNISLKGIKGNNWKIEYISYLPYELFVYDDMENKCGRIIPKIGYFKEEFVYPCIYQNNREWMMITPNEINTMKKAIANAFGRVATYGLGLGYFSYMVSLKENVDKVIIVEKDKEVIELFKKYILPNFIYKDKIIIINMDAFEYNKTIKDIDYVFIDIWHDVGDGLDLYKRFKKEENKNIKYDYWIEESIKCYLD